MSGVMGINMRFMISLFPYRNNNRSKTRQETKFPCGAQ
jgi:hypothetical protein